MRIQCASIPFTLVFEIRGQCASYVLMVTQLLRVAKWPTLTLAVLAVLLLFNYDRLRLKHERDRRILRSTRPTRWVEFAPAVPRLTLRNLWDNCPRDQLAKPDWRPMRIETTSGGGFTNAHWDAHRNQCASGVNTHSMRITALVWTHLRSCSVHECKTWTETAEMWWLQATGMLLCVRNVTIWCYLFFSFCFILTKRSDWTTDCAFHQFPSLYLSSRT